MDPHVLVGVVGRPFGLAGEVYVRPDPDLAEPFSPGTTYDVSSGDRKLTVAASRVHGDRQLVSFAGVTDRAAAESLRGAELSLPRDAVTLEAGAYWASDLLGCEVRDGDGDLVGVLEAVVEGTAHDLLVVARPDGAEVLIPAVADFVRVTGGGVTVFPIPGLLEP